FLPRVLILLPTSLLISYLLPHISFSFFFFIDPAPTAIYTLSLHDALPISEPPPPGGLDHRRPVRGPQDRQWRGPQEGRPGADGRSEEHTSELQSRRDLVCRLLLEKKKKKKQNTTEEAANEEGITRANVNKA